jgi:hypothetical protein
MKRPPLPLLILLLVLLFAAAFLVLDFWAARSNTSASSQVATLRSGEGYDLRPTLSVYVEAPENLSALLSDQLVDRLSARSPFSTVRVIESPGSAPGEAVLVIVLDRRRYIWTPVYASADLDVQVAFASDGEVDWEELGEVNTVMQASPAVRISGELQISDRSWGLISHRAYRRHAAGQVSDRIVEIVNTLQVNSPP